jgi:hypothetical protein
MTAHFRDYTLTPKPARTSDGRFAVTVQVERKTPKGFHRATFHADDGITYILCVEAEKEAINLGKNLIKRNLIGF